ncbi:MAG: hypothetical protein LBC02_09930 [Planctomycetaceae bacterium]|jgi:hypothetical protein|nr:hypothetical protein [Planctomycetaceae bacterium]
MAGGNEAQRSDRFDLSKNMAFTFIIRIFWQFHAVTALRCASFPPAVLLNSYKIEEHKYLRFYLFFDSYIPVPRFTRIAAVNL